MITEAIRNRYLVIIVDEFQDTDPEQKKFFNIFISGIIIVACYL
ncbi:MAG: UvrD-helicase domain-containing protein [Arsenophonus sp. NEOnobi-MAG3]